MRVIPASQGHAVTSSSRAPLSPAAARSDLGLASLPQLIFLLPEVFAGVRSEITHRHFVSADPDWAGGNHLEDK